MKSNPNHFLSRTEAEKFLRDNPIGMMTSEVEKFRVLEFLFSSTDKEMAPMHTLMPEDKGKHFVELGAKIENGIPNSDWTLDFLSMSDEEFWRLQRKLRKDR